MVRGMFFTRKHFYPDTNEKIAKLKMSRIKSYENNDQPTLIREKSQTLPTRVTHSWPAPKFC